MAVVRTFDPKIDLSGAYLGGQRIKLGREQLAQEAASDAARIALGREQLQQEAIANEMQLAAKKDILSREALQKAQEAEIEKSYKETQFGLARRRLEDDERNTMMKVEEAARGMESEQKYQRLRQANLDRGMPEREASLAAWRESGPGRAGFTAALESPGGSQRLGEAEGIRLRSSIQAIDREMTEQRKALSSLKESDLDGKNRVMNRLSSLSRSRNALLAPPQEQQMTVPPGITAATPAPMFQGPLPPPKIFMGAPQGFDAGGFPSGQSTQFIVPPPTPTAPASNEVLKTLKDGRKAFFDVATKKFLRYAD